MKTAVIYASMTGHTKKMVKAIEKETGITVYDVKANPETELKDLDVLFIAGGIYASACMSQLVDYVTKLDASCTKKVYLLCSSMDPNGSLKQIEDVLRDKGFSLGEKKYHSKGSFLFFGLGHPSKTEIEGAVSFVKSIIS